MFILTRTYKKYKKKITISAVTIETTFFSAPLPIQGLLFSFFWNNMFKYTGTLYRNRIQDVSIDTYTRKVRRTTTKKTQMAHYIGTGYNKNTVKRNIHNNY